MTFTGQVQVDFAHDPTSASYTWTDLTSRAQAAQYRRGRNYELGQIQAGSGSLTLKNTDGAFDPSNGSSPYSPNVLPFKRIQHNITVGGVTYPVFTGLVERWPQEWNLQYGTSPIAVVDMFTWLESITLRHVYDQEVLADGPTAFYPLNEPSGATSAGDISANGHAAGTVASSKYGAGTHAFGAAGLTGTGTGLSLSTADPGAVPATGDYLQLPDNVMPSAAPFTIEVWFNAPTQTTSYSPVLFRVPGLLQWSGGTQYSIHETSLGISNGVGGTTMFQVRGTAGTNFIATAQFGGPSLMDGGWHHLVGVLASDAQTVKLYIDGALVNTGASTSPTGYAYQNTGPVAGINLSQAGIDSAFIGTMLGLAIYGSELSATRIAAHYNAGSAAFAGDTADARISRLLGYAGWTATPSLDTCTTTMDAADLNGKTALTAIQDVATSEGGTFFVAKDGTATYKSRRTRMQTTASAVTFGDGTSEVPYLDIAFDFDPTYVYNDIQITRTGGSSVAASDATSRGHYGHRSYTATFGTQSDSETLDAANWLLNNYLAPRMRIRSITVDALATSGAWAALLPLEIGSRVTVKRRPFGGVTITASSFVESIAWTINATTARCALELSPVPLQALIADDTTYGLCDSTFVAAW